MAKGEQCETPKRLTPRDVIKRKLFFLCGNECAMPDCSNVIIDNTGTMVGDIAHIAAAMSDGPCFDPKMTNEDSLGFANLMLLCATHHRQVDGSSSKMTNKELKRIKAVHEDRFNAV